MYCMISAKNWNSRCMHLSPILFFKRFAKSILRQMGYDVVPYQKRTSKHSPDLTKSRIEQRTSKYPPNLTELSIELWEIVDLYTMTSLERVNALVEAVQYVVKNNIPGAIVECGVWRGGSMMAAALTLQKMGVQDRDLFLYDTFSGMPKPDEMDKSHSGEMALEQFLSS